MASQLDKLRSMQLENMEDDARETLEKGIELLEKFELYSTKTVFHVGDIVHWKEGLSCRSVPKENEVGIVTEVFPQPVFDPLRKSAGEPTFREPFTIRVGLIVNNTIHEFFMDGNRMRVIPFSSLSGSRRACAERLRQLQRSLYDPNQAKFKPGDIVCWKPGMKSTRRPEYDQECVVMETFPTFYSDKRGACSTGFREPADVRIGIPDDDGDIMIYVFDSRRFTKVPDTDQ